MHESPPPPALPAPTSPTRFGPYTLLDRIAVGGMAEVFRAQEPRAVGEPRIVVVKRMLPQIAAKPDARAMFEEELRLGSIVRHPNVVEVLGHGEEDGHPYLVLEYVPGADLWRVGRWLARQGRSLSVSLTVYLVRELLAALHAVHEARDENGEILGIVHRDVSPSNVLLSVHGEAKLGDFGIAQRKLVETFGGRKTAPTRAKGKLGYLAPEQVMGLEIDRRADVFAAAVIATELLMGRPLFAGGSELAILLAIRDAKIQPFVEIAPALPGRLGTVLMEALAREPHLRTRSAQDLYDRLTPFLEASEDELRSELGSLVRQAMGTADPATERTPVREALETPVASNDVPRPTTAQIPTLAYQVRTTEGIRGPLTYAQMVEAVATGRVGSHDRVSVGGSEFQEVHEITELKRHLPPSSITTATRDDHVPREPDEQHPLEGGGVVRALALAAVRRDSGLLLFEQGGSRKEVYVRRGVPEFVTSNLAGELLGEYLVSHGVISRSELDMSLAVMPRFEGRLGDTLVALGLVEPVELFRHIAEQVREKVVDLFGWTRGTVAFYAGVEPPQSGFPLGIDPWQLLDEGLGRRILEGHEDVFFRARTTHSVALASPPPPHVPVERLPDGLKALIAFLAVPRKLARIGSHLQVPGDPHRGYRAALLLLHLGVARWEGSSPV